MTHAIRNARAYQTPLDPLPNDGSRRTVLSSLPWQRVALADDQLIELPTHGDGLTMP